MVEPCRHPPLTRHCETSISRPYGGQSTRGALPLQWCYELTRDEPLEHKPPGSLLLVTAHIPLRPNVPCASPRFLLHLSSTGIPTWDQLHFSLEAPLLDTKSFLSFMDFNSSSIDSRQGACGSASSKLDASWSAMSSKVLMYTSWGPDSTLSMCLNRTWASSDPPQYKLCLRMQCLKTKIRSVQSHYPILVICYAMVWPTLNQ